MTKAQDIAIRNHCRLAAETTNPKFCRHLPAESVSVIITVNSGYE